jgi:hypothetical protein
MIVFPLSTPMKLETSEEVRAELTRQTVSEAI